MVTPSGLQMHCRFANLNVRTQTDDLSCYPMRYTSPSPTLLQDPAALISQISSVLNHNPTNGKLIPDQGIQIQTASAVLFLLGPQCCQSDRGFQPCLILNKRSQKVRQPGDLCCPGGSLSAKLDPAIALALRLPGTPLARWSHWGKWRRRFPAKARNLSLLLAAGLREAFEEMRLNPLQVRFVGILPPQQLVMFQREIYPLVCWVPRQRRFKLNWEVDQMVYVPLRNLLDPQNYACLRLQMPAAGNSNGETVYKKFPCFLHRSNGTSETLWGATFRITMAFLEKVFHFKPPEPASLPVVSSRLDDAYLTGKQL